MLALFHFVETGQSVDLILGYQGRQQEGEGEGIELLLVVAMQGVEWLEHFEMEIGRVVAAVAVLD